MNQNQTESKPQDVEEPREEGSDAAACSIFDMECCPKCGGTTGFNYILTIRGSQFQPWKHSELEPSFEDLGHNSKHGAYRCDDCGKIIKSNDKLTHGGPTNEH